MRTFARTIRAVLVCVLALLASVQPILTLGCQCTCKLPASSIENDESSASDCGARCGGKCQCHQARSTASTKADEDAANRATVLGDWLPDCRPCSCPKDCNCHLRHLTRLGISPASRAQINKDLDGAALPPVARSFPPALDSIAIDGRQLDFPRETSALAVCARLCRFAS